LNPFSQAQIHSYTEALAEGDAGVAQTVRGNNRARSMCGLIDQGKKDPRIRELAAQIIRKAGVRAFDFSGEYRAILAWVIRNIRWTRDPTNKEGIQDAATTLKWGIADCDCFSILICSLLGSIGGRTRLVTIASRADDPEQFSHIFPEVRLDGRWIPVDAGRRSPAWAKGPSNWFRRAHWDCDTGEYEEVQQMGGLGMMPVSAARALVTNVPTYYGPPPNASRRAMRQRRRMSGMGDPVDWSDPSTWSSIGSVIQSGSAAAANIISAARATPYNLVPTTSPGAVPRTPYPYDPYATTSPLTTPGIFGMSTGTLLLIAAVGVVIAVARR
jgi:hypothetical protein